MYKCTKCGAEFEGNFCPVCGTKREDGTKICSRCKTVNDANAKFCLQCGNPLEEKPEPVEPVAPEKVEKPVKNDYADKELYKQDLKAYRAYRAKACAYKHDKRRYDKGKGAAPAAIVWLDLNKLWICVAALALVAVITLSSVISSVLSNIFRIGKVSKIELGYTQEQVQKILGEPFKDEESLDNKWVYYDDSYMGVYDKIAKNGEAQEKALLSDNENKLMSLLKEEEKLLKELESLEFKYVEINFVLKTDENDKKIYTVSSVLFDTVHTADENKTDFKKALKSVKLSSGEVNYYVDNTLENGTVIVKDADGKSSYTAEFTDGSFYRAALYGEESKLNGESVTITWQDRFAEYSLSGKANKIGEVSADGVWKAITRGVSTTGNGKIEPHNDSLTSLTIPDSVTEIGEFGFAAFTKLKSVTFHDGITKLGECAFWGCESLENVKLPANLEIIDKEAFSECRALTSIIIPDSVQKLGETAFGYCRALSEVTLGANVHTWPCSLGQVFSRCGNLSKLSVSENNREYRSENNCIILREDYSSDIAGYVALGCKTSIIPDGIKGISGYAFYGCTGISEITLPDSVTYIGEHAFWFSGVTSINLDNITEMRSEAFANCEQLKSVTIPAAIGELPVYAFDGCSALETVIIENGITKLNHAAFNNCTKLKSVTIPASVVYFDNLVFGHCKNLKNINFGGTKAQWNAIETGGNFSGDDWKWNYNTGNYTVHCTDGDIKK